MNRLPVRIPAVTEIEILRLAARCELSAEQRAALSRLTAGEPDWSAVLEAARANRLLPLLAHHLHADPRVPVEVRDQLRRAGVDSLAANLRRVAELRSLLHEFRANEIEVVVLKGPLLALEAYGHLGLRTFDDLDLLVKRRDALRAWNLLKELGYAPLHPVADDRTSRFVDAFPAAAFRGPNESGLVDLHWRLSEGSGSLVTTEEQLWSRTRTHPLHDFTAIGLGREDQIAFLCAHLARHEWSSPHWLVDVAELIRRSPELDWAEVARIVPARRFLTVTLALLEQVFDAELPAAARGIGSPDAAAHEIVADVRRGLFDADKPRHVALRTPWRSAYLRSLPGVGDRLRYLARQVFRPTIIEWNQFPLPAWCSWAYGVIRPVRLVMRRIVGH